MKNIIILLFVLTLISCGQKANQSVVDSTRVNDSLASDTSAAIEIPKPIALPAGYRLDTIQQTDSTRNLNTFISLPVSGNAKLDKYVSDEIEKQKKTFIKDLDEAIKERKGVLGDIASDFHAEAVSVFKDDKVTSYLFSVFYFVGGYAHPMSEYYSFNFDNKTMKRIYASDYFSLADEVEKEVFQNMIAEAAECSASSIPDLKKLDFNIEKDTISFNFDAYEVGPYAAGMPRGRIGKDLLKERINKKYQ